MCKVKKIFKCKNLFLVTFLAIAGFFSAGAFVVNKQAEETPVIERADAATTTDTSATKITIVDFYDWSFATLHIWNVNYKTTTLNGSETSKTYGSTELESFLNGNFGSRNDSMDYYTRSKAWKKVSNTEYYIRTTSVVRTHEDTGRQCSDYCFPSFISSFDYQYTNGSTWGDTHSITAGGSKQWRSKFTNYNSDKDYGEATDAVASFTCYTFYVEGKGLKSGRLATDYNQIGYYFYNPTVPAANNGEVFAGWFTNPACTTPYTLSTHSASVTLYAKFLAPKYVYFTDDLSWGGTIQSVSTTGGASVTYDMRGLYQNGSTKWVYYSAIPDNTTSLKFKSSAGKYTSNITVTSSILDDLHAWYPSGSSNPYTANSWTITADRYPLKTGDKVYIYCDGISDTGCGYAAYFFNQCGASVTETIWSSLVTTPVTDAKEAFGVNYKIYEITVPGVNQVWANMIGTRYDTSKTPSTDTWSGCYNRTFDLAMDKEITTLRFKSYNEAKDDRGNKKIDTDENTLYTRKKVYSTIYGYHFLTQTNGVCVQGGGTNLSTLASRWSTLKTEYNSYDTDIQGAIWVASTTGSDNLSKGMARYDYIFHKYGSDVRFDDFIGRGTGDKSPGWIYGSVRSFSPMELIVGESETDSSVILIIIASSISILSITALSVLMIKKRKSKEQ